MNNNIVDIEKMGDKIKNILSLTLHEIETSTKQSIEEKTKVQEIIDTAKIDIDNTIDDLIREIKTSIRLGNNKSNKFMIDLDQYYNAYTDGSAVKLTSTKNYSGIGVCWGIDHPLNVGIPTPVENCTNNSAELCAILVAMRQANEVKIKKLRIHTDSEYSIQIIPKLDILEQYQYIDPKTNLLVKNSTVLRLIRKETKKHNITYTLNKVKAHADNIYNNIADKLAREGAEQARTKNAQTQRQRL